MSAPLLSGNRSFNGLSSSLRKTKVKSRNWPGRDLGSRDGGRLVGRWISGDDELSRLIAGEGWIGVGRGGGCRGSGAGGFAGSGRGAMAISGCGISDLISICCDGFGETFVGCDWGDVRSTFRGIGSCDSIRVGSVDGEMIDGRLTPSDPVVRSSGGRRKVGNIGGCLCGI